MKNRVLYRDLLDAMRCAGFSTRTLNPLYWLRESHAYTLDTVGTNPLDFDRSTP